MMNPVFLTLYVVIIASVLVILFPRRRPGDARLLWISAAIGMAALLLLMLLIYGR